MRKNKIILGAIVILMIIAVTIVTAIILRKKSEEGESLKDESKITQDDCLLLAEDQLIGEWSNKNTDFPAYLKLVLLEDGEFHYFVEEIEGDREYELSGKWEYKKDSSSIRFNFNEINEVWNNILSDESLVESFTGVVSYSLEDKTIEFKVDYAERENYQGCEEGRYYIDWLNEYLYKSSESSERNQGYDTGGICGLIDEQKIFGEWIFEDISHEISDGKMVFDSDGSFTFSGWKSNDFNSKGT
ncbi:hypothetical protein JW766_00170 [Candidatus Dojkabacteria bacterium]|nr:hypothetical protein [Candidatus Dojkabacteria bacterium]